MIWTLRNVEYGRMVTVCGQTFGPHIRVVHISTTRNWIMHMIWLLPTPAWVYNTHILWPAVCMDIWMRITEQRRWVRKAIGSIPPMLTMTQMCRERMHINTGIFAQSLRVVVTTGMFVYHLGHPRWQFVMVLSCIRLQTLLCGLSRWDSTPRTVLWREIFVWPSELSTFLFYLACLVLSYPKMLGSWYLVREWDKCCLSGEWTPTLFTLLVVTFPEPTMSLIRLLISLNGSTRWTGRWPRLACILTCGILVMWFHSRLVSSCLGLELRSRARVSPWDLYTTLQLHLMWRTRGTSIMESDLCETFCFGFWLMIIWSTTGAENSLDCHIPWRVCSWRWGSSGYLKHRLREMRVSWERMRISQMIWHHFTSSCRGVWVLYSLHINVSTSHRSSLSSTKDPITLVL